MSPEQQATIASAIAAAISAAAAIITAVIAIAALWAQHRAGRPKVRVRFNTPMLFVGGSASNPYAAILVHNSGRVPVTVKSASIVVGSARLGTGQLRSLWQPRQTGSIPFMGPPPVGLPLDTLPKRLEPGEEVTLIVMTLREAAEIHVGPRGPVRWVEATLAGSLETRSKPLNGRWLRRWAPAEV